MLINLIYQEQKRINRGEKDLFHTDKDDDKGGWFI